MLAADLVRQSERQHPLGRIRRQQRGLRLEALGERALYVDCDVLQADGGTRTASITGAYVALALASDRLTKAGLIARSPLRDSIAAVSVGIVNDEVLLDLPYAEDARAQVDMNVVQTGSGQLVEVQGTGEEATFTRAQLDRMLDMASKGIGELIGIQQKALSR